MLDFPLNNLFYFLKGFCGFNFSIFYYIIHIMEYITLDSEKYLDIHLMILYKFLTYQFSYRRNVLSPKISNF